MIRPFTLVTMLLAAGSGAYLFAVKHHAQTLDDQIADISQASRLDAQRIRVLQAQWALETDPTRLQQLATQFTNLQPMQPAQLITLAALKSSLPAPGSAAPASNPELPGQMLPELDAANAPPDADPQAPLVAGGLPLPPPQAPMPAPAMLASANPAPGPLQIRPQRRVNHVASANTELAEILPAPRPDQAPHVFTPAPAESSYRTVPMGAQVMSVRASASVPQYAPAASPAAADNSGSALGMAADAPPPQPLQAGLNN